MLAACGVATPGEPPVAGCYALRWDGAPPAGETLPTRVRLLPPPPDAPARAVVLGTLERLDLAGAATADDRSLWERRGDSLYLAIGPDWRGVGVEMAYGPDSVLEGFGRLRRHVYTGSEPTYRVEVRRHACPAGDV